jgi:hypothetical protein
MPPANRSAQLSAWRLALAVTFVLLAILAWLLARLVWLPMYFGLFFFLVAGLLISAVAFRIARPARPLSRATIVRGAIFVSILTIVVTVIWEYRHFAATVGDPPHFADARNAAVRAGRSAREVRAQAMAEFKSALRAQYAPGGVIGYALWTMRSGEMKLTVEGVSETVHSSHRGLAWPLRTLAAVALLAAGLWLGLESLRSETPVTNVLAPGEEALEEE